MSQDQTITIEVDGCELQARPGAMLIEVTDAAGIFVPRFCYHKKLSVAANCRMCLVEVERAAKPMPACATPVSAGMKVHTRSPLALAAQKGTMEFLLINHPLDCPICDQGGECELQDVAMGYGSDLSRFSERKRAVASPDIGPLIQTDMTRCIHCTRCVRFGTEIAGVRELGATGRGEHMTIGTYIASTVDSELSGNVIDLCPVGALTSKPFLFRARAWELSRYPSLAPHDAVGSNLFVYLRRGRVMRVSPRDNEAVNECWISDRDRFSYEGLYSEDRLARPMVKKDGKWREVDWPDALDAAVKALKRAGAGLASLISPRASVEESYLAQKLTRGLGSGSVDHRLRQADFRDDPIEPPLAWLGMPIAGIEQLQAALIIGGNPRKDQPLIGHRLRQAALTGAAISYLSPLGLDLAHAATQLVVPPSGLVRELAALARAAGLTTKVAPDAKPGAEHRRIAGELQGAERAAVLLGPLAQAHPDYAVLRGLAHRIAEKAGCTLGYVSEGCNGLGARLAGALPLHGPGGCAAEMRGLDAGRMVAERQAGYLLLDVDPALDCWDPSMVLASLAGESPVVALSVYRTPALESCTDVLLPVGAFTETSGTFVNAAGLWQSFPGVANPLGEARPAWKVLRVLGNMLDLGGFEQNSSEEVLAEVRALCEGAAPENRLRGEPTVKTVDAGGALERIGEVPIYASDSLVRRAPALQRTADARRALSVRVHPLLAERLGAREGDPILVKQGAGRLERPVQVDPKVPDGCVWMPAGVEGSGSLGGQFGDLTLEKV